MLTPVDSGEKSTVLNSRQLQDFSVVGRSAAEFLKIMPGFSITNGIQNRSSFTGEVIGINGNGDGGNQSALNAGFSAQGAPTNNIDITADGAHVSDPGCNCATPVNPNTDMIQEFQVMTNSFNAENSKGPVVINTVAKSGTRDFHGMGYLYARHFSMNANDWLNNSTGTKRPESKFFFPGANISGPVIIPGTGINKSREKLFFFTGFEYYKQTLDSGQLLRATVPTEGMRQGNFSPAELAKLGAVTSLGQPAGQVTDPNFPGGNIPQSAFYPGADKLLNLYPAANRDPNQTGGYNYVQALVFDQNSYQSMSRIDYNLSDNTKLFVRANIQNELQQFPVSLWWRPGGSNSVPYPTPIDGKNTSKSVSASLTHVFSPSLTNEFVFGYTFIDFPNVMEDKTKVDRTALGFNFPGVFHNNNITQIPGLGAPIQGGASTSEVAYLWNPGGFEAGHGNLYATKHMMNFGDNLSKVISTHTLKFGFFTEYLINNQPANNFTNGQALFGPPNPSSSGNYYADILLGRPQNYQEANLNPLHNEAYKTYEFFAQDSWKVTRHFTLNFGLRAQHLGNWYDREGIGFAVWDPASYDPAVTDPTAYTGVQWYKRNKSIANSGYASRALFYAPRFGLAWDLFGNGNTVLRGGWGQFRFNTAQSTQGMDVGWGVLTYNQNADLQNPGTFQDLQNVTSVAQGRSGLGLVDRHDDQKPLTTNYNFTISQRVGGSTLFELAYVGSHSEHLGGTGTAQGGYNVNINAVPVGGLFVTDPANPAGGYDNYRPFPNYQDINIGQFIGYSNYNSLMATASRTRGRYSYQVNYTWSKTLGLNAPNSTVPDIYNIDNNYGIAASDRTHIFNAAYSVELGNPVNGHAILKGLANGWQISGITQLQSGIDLAANQGNFGLDQTDRRTILGTDQMNLFPVLTCDPAANLGKNQYINGACFAAPTQPGANGPIRIPAVRGPWFVNSDLSGFKNFRITESKKLQFRFSAYNFLNHPIRSFTGGNELTLGSSAFGFAPNKYGHRIISLAAKFYF